MIALDGAGRHVGDLELLPDHEDPFAFWVLPPAPSVARDDAGAPRLTLLRFLDGGKVVGGHLSLTLELAWPDGALEAARAELAAALQDDKLRTKLRPLQLLDGSSAQILFIGKETAADGTTTALLQRAYGVTPPKLDPPYTASFSALLTADGARLVEAALRSGAAPIAACFRLRTEGVRPALQVTATVDWRRVYEHFSSNFRAGYFFGVEDVTDQVEKLVEAGAVTIRAVQAVAASDGQPAPDVGPALNWIQRDIVERLCEPAFPPSRTPARSSLGTLGELLDMGCKFSLKAVDQTELSTAEVDLQIACVVGRTLTLQTHLADLGGGASADTLIADAGPDAPFFKRFELAVDTARPLAATFVKELDAAFQYGSTTAALRLDDAEPTASISTWADHALDATWTLALSATMRDDAPIDPGRAVDLGKLTGKERALTVDLERAMALRAIEVRGTADDRVVATTVELAQQRDGATVGDPRVLQLVAGAARATAYFRDVRASDSIVATTKHQLKDGRVVTPERVVADARVLLLPPPFPGSMTVHVRASDDWEGLDHVLVTLQKAADAPTRTFDFAKAGQDALVALDLPDPVDRSYRFRVARVLTDGTSNEDPWAVTDVPLLVVGATARDKLVVDVSLVGLDFLAAGVQAIEVELRYVDPPNQVRAVQVAVLEGPSETYHWEVALKDPEKRQYSYQVTVDREGGRRDVGPWVTSSERLLVVTVTKAS